MMRTQIWMSGGGTQSAAIAALIVKGVIEPPDLAVIVDTEREQSVDIGKLSTYCSNEWKRRVGQRWAVKEYGVRSATNWIGYSTDELERIPNLRTGKWQDRFPLIDQKMNRGDCTALVVRMGWPAPPRSSCWMCPNHTQAEWRDIRDHKPKDWRRAVLFDRWIRMYDPHAFVHSDAVPLDQADLDDANESLFTRCDSGVCFV